MAPGLNPLDDDHQELEAILKGMRPAGLAVDRDRFMYRAGKAAASRASRSRFWMGSTVLMTTLCLCLSTKLAFSTRTDSTPHAPIMADSPQTDNNGPASAPNHPDHRLEQLIATLRTLKVDRPNYLLLRNRVLEEGAEQSATHHLDEQVETVDHLPGQESIPTARSLRRHLRIIHGESS